MLVMLGAVASSMAIPRLLGTAIDSALSDGVRADLAILAGVIIGLGLIRGLTGYFQSYLSEGVSQRGRLRHQERVLREAPEAELRVP